MTPQFSVFLDLLRLAAALAVLVSHSNSRQLTVENLMPQSVGHNAVVVFFLLSGYVIAYVTSCKERTATAFWISRAARIYSVALPALALTLLLDGLGSLINPAHYAGDVTTHDHGWLRLLISVTFTNELWLISVMPFSNSPYWSLCYEMAYYLLFSIWCFAPAERRYWYLALAMLLIGPKILLLAPIWLLGVVLYRWKRIQEISVPTAWALTGASSAAILAFQWLDIGARLSAWTEQWLGPWLYVRLHFSKHFLGDYLLALGFAALFVGVRCIAPQVALLSGRCGRLIVRSASYTFSIYLFHLPILVFTTMLTSSMERGPVRHIGVVSASLLVSVLLGHVTEQRKETLKRFLRARFSAQPVPQSPTP